METKTKAPQNDAYHEQVREAMGDFTQEDLINKINACQDVVDKLEGDPVWKTVLADAQMWVKTLDAKWQEIYDVEKLNSLRVLKLAYAHIAALPAKYKVDLKTAQDLLDKMRNTDSSVQKDCDNETNIED